MNQFIGKLVIACVCLFLGACVSHDLSDHDRNQFVTEFYAHVESIEDVRFASEAGEAALSWGLWGALENSHGDRGDILGGAIVGALLGGLITSIAEGPRDGYEYHLQAVDGDYVVVVLDNYPADVGQCVRVRMSSEVRLYATDASWCEFDDNYDMNDEALQ